VARNPHEQGGLATPPPQLDDDEPADEPADVDDDDQGDAGDDPAGDAQGETRPARTGGRSRRGSIAGDGAGYLLGLVLWAGVALPFIHGGPAGVKAWWLAKFLNHAPDGSDLP
jgi:hypothetical protein